MLETEKVLKDGWFHTGDQGEVNSRGNWRISGRIKNLLILNSGHNIAPEPIEEKLAQLLAGAQQIVLVGNGRGLFVRARYRRRGSKSSAVRAGHSEFGIAALPAGARFHDFARGVHAGERFAHGEWAKFGGMPSMQSTAKKLSKCTGNKLRRRAGTHEQRANRRKSR